MTVSCTAGAVDEVVAGTTGQDVDATITDQLLLPVAEPIKLLMPISVSPSRQAADARTGRQIDINARRRIAVVDRIDAAIPDIVCRRHHCPMNVLSPAVPVSLSAKREPSILVKFWRTSPVA